ncbi:hypothetical protein F5I97DRAFT_1925487 [Phlebopus sp. FC_14]|nr:hypothetical protein F5I97DRAFT_1925487 [Phlebopus sp. FC_14]
MVRVYSSLQSADTGTGAVDELSGITGRYVKPVVSRGDGSNRTIAFVEMGGDLLTGAVADTAHTGIWIDEITLPTDQTNETYGQRVLTIRPPPLLGNVRANELQAERPSTAN